MKKIIFVEIEKKKF